jgi:hypothetical protein
MKKLFLVLLGVGLLVIAGCAAASWWIMRQLGPEIWVAQLEANLNC